MRWQHAAVREPCLCFRCNTCVSGRPRIARGGGSPHCCLIRNLLIMAQPQTLQPHHGEDGVQ
jgi:hypothetical protein